jgi:hypothetical protein
LIERWCERVQRQRPGHQVDPVANVGSGGAADGTVPWLVVDDDGVPVEPIRRYLADFVAQETSRLPHEPLTRIFWRASFVHESVALVQTNRGGVAGLVTGDAASTDRAPTPFLQIHCDRSWGRGRADGWPGSPFPDEPDRRRKRYRVSNACSSIPEYLPLGVVRVRRHT